jgi:hypothetical protein
MGSGGGVEPSLCRGMPRMFRRTPGRRRSGRLESRWQSKARLPPSGFRGKRLELDKKGRFLTRVVR